MKHLQRALTMFAWVGVNKSNLKWQKYTIWQIFSTKVPDYRYCVSGCAKSDLAGVHTKLSTKSTSVALLVKTMHFALRFQRFQWKTQYSSLMWFHLTCYFISDKLTDVLVLTLYFNRNLFVYLPVFEVNSQKSNASLM